VTYTAPIAEQRFVLETVAGLEELARLPGFEAASPDLIDAVLGEAAKLAENGFAPLNRIGDTEGARLEDGRVRLPAGFAEAYRQYVEAGWASLGAGPAHGGQGLPFSLGCAVQEQLTSANMAFSLCMMLSQGAIEALERHGSDEQQRLYLPKLVSGEWTGTMNLTEPQAGSDVGALRTRAEPAGDGSWRIKGQKIFITWGEHELAENIVHMVLARTPDAPPGTKGISLFLVPKYLVRSDGSLGARNGVRCVSIEHKLGIHASPTCTMSFGEDEDCAGWLVGEEMAGMRAMFTMMNHARINVGLQGVAIAERAYQGALAFAKERVQGRRIIEHADVRRMLMTAKATTEAVRALVYATAAAVDRAHAEPDPEARRLAQGRADLLTPVAKAYATDMGVEIASLSLQVFGGMGYIEETGAAQHLRDARIAPIYEGTNGIQAMDLVGRKLGLDGGEHLRALIAEMRSAELPQELATGINAMEAASEWLQARSDPEDPAAGASPYLRMFGIVVGGWLMAKQAEVARTRLERGEEGRAFLEAKIATARFFAEQVVPQAAALLGPVTRGRDAVFALGEERL
jgi:alkylation response protein AidB-like acyl-CoA dehydrogenase